ncbi:MAG: hypothetical protein EBZ58_13795 [Bacteroidetes bacterium]|nr:hypothetical protein [Bacteroidota bacterium]
MPTEFFTLLTIALHGTEADILMVFKPVYEEDNSIMGVSCMRSDITEYTRVKKQIEEKENRIAKMIIPLYTHS